MGIIEPKTFVLVHAAWLGGWAWKQVSDLLQKEGHTVLTPDLPGHGSNLQDSGTITLDSYVQTLSQVIEQVDGPVVLVGHSFTGVPISQVGERLPDQVAKLVYIAAALLPNGVSFLQAVEGVTDSEMLNNLVFSEDGETVTVKDEARHHALAHDVPLEAFQAALPNMVPEPTAPLGNPLVLSSERWGRIPRYYIECTEDRAVSLAVQQAMCANVGVEKVYSLASSHSPLFSCPDKLAASLSEISQQ